MVINFLVPTLGLTGGIKVIFEHANRLASFGHDIIIIYPYVLDYKAGPAGKVFGRLKKLRRVFLGLIKGDEIGWFKLDSRVQVIRVMDLSAKNIPNADATIATANETADWLNIYPENKGEKFYFIQDYENWTRAVDKVDRTWKMPLKKIVISRRLEKLAREKFAEDVFGIVPDGVEMEKFANPDKKFNSPKKILAMHHALPKKGFTCALEAYKIVKKRHPEISLDVFGAYKSGKKQLKGLEGVRFYYQPEEAKLRELYGRADIFLWPSREEGFGLPPMEAMAAKCAVISTDTGAIREYAVPDKTAVIVPPERPELMAEALTGLIENNEKLKKISLNGYEKIRAFSWEKSSKILERIIIDECAK